MGQPCHWMTTYTAVALSDVGPTCVGRQSEKDAKRALMCTSGDTTSSPSRNVSVPRKASPR